MRRSQNCQAGGKWAPSWPPRRGWQDKTALCLKETLDNEIIFNLCPFEALPAPVILDGTAREGASQIHTKPGNYCTNYSLLMLGGRGGGGVITGPWFRWTTRLLARQLRLERPAGEQLFHSFFPRRYLTSCHVCNLYFWERGGRRGGGTTKQPQNF